MALTEQKPLNNPQSPTALGLHAFDKPICFVNS